MLAIFEVLPDDTVRARVFTDWMRLDLTYSGDRCVVSEAVEVLPEGEGSHWRLERRVYRDVEVPWYICHGVIRAAAYPDDCKIGGTYRREVGGRLEAHVELRLFNNDGAACHLSQSDIPIPLFAMSAYLRSGTTVVGIEWEGVKRVDAREWEEWYRDPRVMDLAPWLRRVIAGYRFDDPTPPKSGVRVAPRTTDDGFVGVHLHHDLMHLDLQMWDGKCVAAEYTVAWADRRGGEYVLYVRDGIKGSHLPLHLCDAFVDGLFSLRDAWHKASAWSDYVDSDEGVVEELGLSFGIDLMDFAARGVMEPLRPLYAIYLTALGFPVRTIDGEDVDSWASRHRDWHRAIAEEVKRLRRA